jgi:hypothetical protein
MLRIIWGVITEKNRENEEKNKAKQKTMTKL